MRFSCSPCAAEARFSAATRSAVDAKLVAVESIDGLLASEDAERARFRTLLVEEEEKAILRLALLLHDIGKGTRPGDHVRGSVESAERLMARWRVPAAAQEKVRLLIEHHLVLSLIVNGRDLEDPATARFLTSKTGTQEDLRRLTLATYADISAVNPTAMSPTPAATAIVVYTMSDIHALGACT